MSPTTYLEKRRTVEAHSELDSTGQPTGNVIVTHEDENRELMTYADFTAQYELPRQRAQTVDTGTTPAAPAQTAPAAAPAAQAPDPTSAPADAPAPAPAPAATAPAAPQVPLIS